MNWQIQEVTLYERNSLKGFFQIGIGPLVIKGCTYHELNGKSWCAFPGAPRLDANGAQLRDEAGKPLFNNLVAIPDRQRYADFQAWAKPLVRAELERLRAQPKGDPKNAASDPIPF